jgi:ATP-dependent exoDNAse (exonuclease V) beta subunit
LAKLLPFLPLFDQPDQIDSADSSHGESSSAFQPPDAAARAQALDIQRSFIVEAPAGSGKTGLLIQRFLKLLADESVTTPEQVLAITFTLKATAEMRDRVLDYLTKAANSTSASSRQPAILLDIAASAAPAPAISDFLAQTRSLAHVVLERDRQLGWALLDHPQRLNIRTIDSVCSEIARSLPVLSGGGGRLAPVEDADPLYREAARRTLLLLGGGDADLDSALRTLLLHRAGNLAQIETLLAEMLKLRDQWGDLIPLNRAHLDETWLDENVLPRLEQALDHAICANLSKVEQLFPADLLSELSAIASEMARADGYNGVASPIAVCKTRSESPEAVAAHLDHWRSLVHLLLTAEVAYRKERGLTGKNLGFEYDRKHRHHRRLATVVEQLHHRDDLLLALDSVRALPPAHYPREQWKVAKALFRVLSHALVELQFVFAERNQCDFTELSLLARNALGQDAGTEDLAAALGARLQHLLVDEMQDTSTGQYQLLELLTAQWDGHSQTVFLVGDPRQSIYLFRQARVERFVITMNNQHLGDLPLTPLRLTANFRSQKNLVDQFNIDFSRIFAAEDFGTEANALSYEPAQATLPASPTIGGPIWHINPVPSARAQNDLPNAPTSTQIRQQQARHDDAREIRRIALEWLAKPLPAGRTEPWRLAVLVRSRNHLSEIVAELRKGDNPIPFRAVDIETLNERQEVLDLTALTRALLHPADRVAALAILRAPWCGLTLANLHTLTGADDSSLKEQSIQCLIAERAHLLPDESIQRLTRVWNVVQSLAGQRTRLTTAQLVERAWRSLGGDAWLNPAQLTNAQRFFELLDKIDSESPNGRIEPTILKHRLENLYSEPEPIPERTPYIDLLTIHKAKGLEWDVVFVPALERPPAISGAHLLTWSEIGSAEESDRNAAHIMLAPIRGTGEESHKLNTWIYRLHRAREAAEHKRLFYVACTRARQELHLFAAPQVSAKGRPSPGRDSLLKAAWLAAAPHIALTLGSPEGVVPETEDETSASDTNFIPPPEPLFLDLAAATPGYQATIQLLPPNFVPEARFASASAQSLTYTDAEATGPTAPAFARPEGSFAARSFGNAVHAFLEIVATRLVSGLTATALLTEIPTWKPRIAAILRADGLPRNTVDRLTRDTRTAIEKALRDPLGLWLLTPHPGAANELGRTAWLDTEDASASTASIRIDRVFYAGPEPHAPGSDVLWIVDYKTASHGPKGLDEFLDAQRAAYAPQLETYARILTQTVPHATPPRELRVALYYPAIQRLIWWKPITP